MTAQYFHYKIVETKPLSALEEFKNHHRLQTFYHKGCKCVNCGIEATQIALGEGRGSYHWDVYTDDFYPLTVDHIVPRSKGGSDTLDNYQPMCYKCNQRKGSNDWVDGKVVVGTGVKSNSNNPCNQKPKYPIKDFRKACEDTIQIGLSVFKKRSHKKLNFLGIVDEITINPHTGLPAIVLVDKPGSYYHIKSVYIQNEKGF